MSGKVYNAQQELIKTLFINYTRSARPADPNTTINVTFGIEIVQIVEVVSFIINFLFYYHTNVIVNVILLQIKQLVVKLRSFY